ncbi:MAG: glycosyl transferase family 1, partial [Mesorhizobium sp.]
LGATRDGRFAQRLAAVTKAAVSIASKLGSMPRPDLIIARNLEMLALARRARSAFQATVPIVYECLDIHRLML